MRIFLLVSVIASLTACKQSTTDHKITFADNIVVAHRGAWKANDLPENSIAALKHAISIGCTGSEFDVRMTGDDILIVTHDESYASLNVEKTTYEDLAKHKLDNGEILPTLEQYILAGMEHNKTTGLVCEIKPASTKERGERMAQKAVELVAELQAERYISSYISFDYNILKKIVELNPNAHTQYLDGSKTPKELAKDGISGLDYHINAFKNNPQWITEAKDLGLSLNVWTVNEQLDIDLFVDHGFDYITTNEPELLYRRMEESPVNNGYELVWSDEFNYQGKPDTNKWSYEYGFIANEEQQYYTDQLKNARVQDGNLIIEAHKEKIKNEKYKSKEYEGKSHMKYAAEIDTAQYTSARLITEGKASWKYGIVEVSAKLPTGRGIWPAIWMLGDNRSEVGWPRCGEIDIMEYVGYDPDTIHGTIHSEAYNHMKNTEKTKNIFVENVYDEFHIYAVEWTPEKIDFSVNGEIYNSIQNEHKTDAEWPFDQEFSLILNVAVGGSWGGQKGIDNSILPNEMQVDYARVFQIKK